MRVRDIDCIIGIKAVGLEGEKVRVGKKAL